MALAIIGGNPSRFSLFANLYKESLREFGKDLLPVSIHSPGHVSETDEQAREEQWPHYQKMIARIGAERGWPAPSKEQFVAEIEHGSQYVGSPETVAKKIVHALTSVGAQRFDFKYASGPQPHSKLMRSIELYGSKVIPLVKEMLAK